MDKTGLALAREREKRMESRMLAILDDEGEVKQILKRFGLIPGEDEYEQALAIWRDYHGTR